MQTHLDALARERPYPERLRELMRQRWPLGGLRRAGSLVNGP
jgi:hypothetical protein